MIKKRLSGGRRQPGLKAWLCPYSLCVTGSCALNYSPLCTSNSYVKALALCGVWTWGLCKMMRLRGDLKMGSMPFKEQKETPELTEDAA